MLLRAAVLLHLQSAACAAAVSFAAGVPTLATKTQHAGEYVFFPQTLRRVDFVPKDTLLISYQRDAGALRDDGWKGGLLGGSGGEVGRHGKPFHGVTFWCPAAQS